MMNKEKITETDSFQINVDKKTLSDPNKTKELGVLQKKNPNVEFDLDSKTSQNTGGAPSLYEVSTEVIEPKDAETIKYLSNVKDEKSGEISQPFSIGNKKYQMVRGITPKKEKVMGVFCHDDLDENGSNLIHSLQYFEENIANPMKEEMAMVGADIQVLPKEEVNTSVAPSLGQYKFFLVNEKTGKFRKFKTVVELAKSQMREDEKFMGLKEMKKFFESKVFGGKPKQQVVEDDVLNGQEDEVEMNSKAKKLIDLIKTKIPAKVVESIKTPIAKREVIAAFAEMIGVPRNQLPTLVSGLKDLVVKQSTQQTMSEGKKVIKVIKVKDLDDDRL